MKTCFFRAVARWIEVLAAFGYLEPVNKNVYEMNVMKVPRPASILRNIPQAHII